MIYSLKYSNDMPITSSGYAKAWFIRIRPNYSNDIGLLEHEKCHVAQFWRTFGLHPILYRFNLKYRLKSEVEAYRTQLQYPHPRYTQDQLREMYAGWLSDPSEDTGYGLTLSKEAAIKLLGG